MASQLSAHAITAHTAMTRISVSRCSTLPRHRGSASAQKCSTSFSADIAPLPSLIKGEPAQPVSPSEPARPFHALPLVWVAGANRYRNPDEDLPADFDAQRAGHYQALDLPLDASAFIDGLREEMPAALAQPARGRPRNPDVRITSKRGGWISLPPLLPRPSPANIEALKAEVADTWPLTSLLDIVKEADLRLGFTCSTPVGAMSQWTSCARPSPPWPMA